MSPSRTDQDVRAITVSPEFWADDPERAASIIAEKMQRNPATVWMIVIGPHGSAERIMDGLFMYGPAEEPVEPV